MKTQHTPGEWRYEPVMQTGLNRPYERFNIYALTPPNYENNYGINTGSKKKYIGVLRAQPNKTVTGANARLIASAPELLAALEEFIACGPNAGDNDALIKQCKAAINKAKGI